jgi:predicted nuclease of predicted toxin-antitoxin system
VADKLRFHLDEHILHAIAKGLRQRGIEVTTTVEAGLRTLSDDSQMAYIRREQRVFVTSDAGFLARHARGEEHFGIVYFPTASRSIGDIITFMVLLHEILSPPEMINRIEYL